MSDYFEQSLFTDPSDLDTDNDQISDKDEQTRATIPYRYDSDGDGLSDYDESYSLFESTWKNVDHEIVVQTFYTDPLNPDHDDDGFHPKGNQPNWPAEADCNDGDQDIK